LQQLIPRPYGLLLALSLFLTMITVQEVSAQAPDALVVTVSDSSGAGVPGVTVVVRDRSGVHELSRGITDSRGGVAVAALPANSVRIAVSGSLSNGAQLYLSGDDAPGILLDLTAPPTLLDLRVEPDGQVRPDPGTMIVPDLGIPVDDDAPVFPTAIRAEPAIPAVVTATTLLEPAQLPEAADPLSTRWWLGLAILVLLIAAIVVMVRLLATRETV
jgi:hypothetical protein